MFRFGKRHGRDEAYDEARLINAEQDLTALTERASEVIRTLEERRKRNHWRESIEQMIRGA